MLPVFNSNTVTYPQHNTSLLLIVMPPPPESPQLCSEEAYHDEVRTFLNQQLSKPRATQQSSLYNASYEDRAELQNLSEVIGPELEAHIQITDLESASPLATDSNAWCFFDGDRDEHRYARLRCAIHLAALNAQPITVSMKERARAWHESVVLSPAATDIL